MPRRDVQMLVRDHIQLVRARKMFAECVNIGAGLMLHCLWVAGSFQQARELLLQHAGAISCPPLPRRDHVSRQWHVPSMADGIVIRSETSSDCRPGTCARLSPGVDAGID